MSTDGLGRLIRSTEYDANNTITQRTEHRYDAYSRLSSQSWVIQGDPFSESYTYNDPTDSNASGDGSLKQMTTASEDIIEYTYDALKRLQRTSVYNYDLDPVMTNSYAYWDLETANGVTQTTSQVKFHNVRSADETLLTGAMYTYDEVGNIIAIHESQKVGSNASRRPLALYEYDVQNQLTSETIYTYDKENLTVTPSTTTTYTYTYDTAGNILTESKNGTVTKTYTYGNSQWNDLLTKVNGTTITYDEIGNPLSYTNGAQEYHFSWDTGRTLRQATVDGSESYYIGYDYDLDGIRTKKTVTADSTGTTTTHEYITQNGKIVRETMTSGTATRVFDFIYDADGSPVAVPEKICGLTLILDFFDRCHSLASLHPPPAAVGSLPLRLQVHDQRHDDHHDVLRTEFTG